MKNKRKKCIDCFRALSDETRLKILHQLQKDGEQSVGGLTKLARVTQPTVSHHLDLLSSVGIVTKRKLGRNKMYMFNSKYACRGCGVLTLPLKL